MLEKPLKSYNNRQQDVKKGVVTINALKYLQKKTDNRITYRFLKFATEKTEIFIKREKAGNKKVSSSKKLLAIF